MVRRLSALFSSKEFLLFLMAGGLAATVNFLSRIFYNHYVDFSQAIVLAYVTGMVTAFLLSKLFVFEHSKRATRYQAFYFFLVNVFAILQTWLISMFLYHYVLVWLNIQSSTKEIAHLIGVMVPVFSSYLGHKYITFK